MGFSLDMFFDELIEVLDSDITSARKIRKLLQIITSAKQYAKQCGMLNTKD